MRKKLLGNQKGVALITVVLVISMLVAAAIELNRSMRGDIHDAANTGDGVKLVYVAKSGFYAASALLINASGEYDTLRAPWANAEALSMQSKDFFPNAHFIVRIEDEKGKIPLNKLVDGNIANPRVRGLLLALLKLPEFELDEARAAEIVDSIIDWIDADDDTTGSGAESSYYASQGLTYGAKNGPLDCIEELLMIRGITSEIYAGTKEKPGLSGFVTIHGTGAVNINTAPKMVLRALSPEITADVADRMDEYRRMEGNNLSSPQWYKNVAGLEDITLPAELIETVKSNYFKIDSIGVASKMELGVTGIIQRSPFRIMSWRQNG